MEPLVPLRVPAKSICLSIILVLLYAIPSSSTDASIDVPRNVSVDGIIFEGEILGKPPKCRPGKYCKLKRCRNAPVCKDKKKPKKPKKEKEKVEYCETARCLDTAKLIKANMDEQINPCDDFYSFACNGFSKQYPQPEGSNHKDVDFHIDEDVFDKILEILNGKYSKNSDSIALAKARKKFKKCELKKGTTRCVKRAMGRRDIWPLAREFVLNFGMADTEKTHLERMMSNIRQSFMNDLSAIPWLDDETEKNARKKAKAVKLVISHKEELFEVDEIPPDKLDENNRITENAEDELPTTQNAEYFHRSNSVFLSRAELNYPYFNLGLPVLDYAAIGSVLAHEFTHGFDSFGRAYDGNGNKKDWWSAKAAEEFKKRVRCFAEQYYQFHIITKNGEELVVSKIATQRPIYFHAAEDLGRSDWFTSLLANQISTILRRVKEDRSASAALISYINLQLNSVETFDEDIADNGGVSLSYRAYKKLNPKKEKLRDLEDYTDEQLFFIGYANSFCRSETIEYTEETIKTDNHSPPKYRVNVPLSNMKAFATAFKCRKGTNMNPIKKCEIW